MANDLKPFVDEYFAAVKAGDPVAEATAAKAVRDARAPMTEFEEAIHASKETWGRTGVALQQLLRQDFSVEAILRRGQEKNHGKPLDTEQVAKLTKLGKQFEELQKQSEDLRKENDQLKRDIASKEQHEAAVKTTKQSRVRKKSERRRAAEKKLAVAWVNFGKVGRRTRVGVPIDALPAAIGVAKAYVELGVVRFSEFMAHVNAHEKNADEALFRKAWDQASGDVAATELDIEDRAGVSKEDRRIQRSLVAQGRTADSKCLAPVVGQSG